MTAVEWLVDKILFKQELYTDKDGDWIDEPRTVYVSMYHDHTDLSEFVAEAIKIEQNDTDNKVIHFAEWITKKHTLTLTAMYEQFIEEYYGDK